MSGTSEFIIQLHNTESPHLDLTLEHNGKTRFWILPGGVPEIEKDRKIAIEEPADGTGAHRLKDRAREDGYGRGELKTWDRGSYSVETENSIKCIICAGGQRFKGKFLLHNPGWGRWTKKKLWVLEKVPDK